MINIPAGTDAIRGRLSKAARLARLLVAGDGTSAEHRQLTACLRAATGARAAALPDRSCVKLLQLVKDMVEAIGAGQSAFHCLYRNTLARRSFKAPYLLWPAAVVWMSQYISRWDKQDHVSCARSFNHALHLVSQNLTLDSHSCGNQLINSAARSLCPCFQSRSG